MHLFLQTLSLSSEHVGEQCRVLNPDWWTLRKSSTSIFYFHLYLSLSLFWGSVQAEHTLYMIRIYFQTGFLINTDRSYIHESWSQFLPQLSWGVPTVWLVSGLFKQLRWGVPIGLLVSGLCSSSFLAVSCWWIVYCLFSSFSRDGDFKVKSGFTQHHHGYIFHGQLSLEELCFLPM